MDKQQAKRMAMNGTLDSFFDQAKAEEKRLASLPTLEFRFMIMSEDPDDDSEDNSQKYSQTGYGKTKDDAEKDAISRFKDEYGNLPIYWIKDYDRPF